MVHRNSLLVMCGCLALLLAFPAYAVSDITAATITTGRLYVFGTTDQPHTQVRLDGKFDTVSDEKGFFQFELVYHPAGCIIRAEIGGRTVEAVVGQCGEICKPAQQANAPQMPKLGSAKPSPEHLPAAPIPPVHAEGKALVTPVDPAATYTLPPAAPTPTRARVEGSAKSILHAPLPPLRPRKPPSIAARTTAPAPAVKPLMVKPRPAPQSLQQKTLGDRPLEEPLDAPERSDIY